MRLRQQEVYKSAARATRAFDQQQIFGAKYNRPQDAKIIGQLSNWPRIEAQGAFSRRPVHFGLVLPLADDLAADEISLLSMAHHLRAADAAEGAQGRNEVN